ncbi:MAG: DegT/DnrJ/EryC1/StrS family aminotransferase [Polyangiales bacterium]
MVTPRDVVPLARADLLRAVRDTLRGDDLPAVRDALRDDLRRVTGARHAFLFPDARTGIHALLRSVARRRPGGEVLLPDYNFFAVPAMVRRAGLRPVFVDVRGPHGEMDPSAAAAALTPRTALVLLGHFFGRPNDLPRWRAFADAHGLALLEDAAHAFGAHTQGRAVGRWGLGGAFSLSLTKGLTGVMGGAVVTDDDDAAAWLRSHERASPTPPRAEVLRALLSALGGTAMFGDTLYPLVLQRVQRVTRGDFYESLMREKPLPLDPPAVPTYAALPSACAALARAHLPRALADIDRQRDCARAVIDAGPWRRFTAPTWDDDRHATFVNLVLRADDPAGLRRALLRAGFDTRADYLTSSTGDAARYPESVRLARSGVYLPVRALRDDAARARMLDALRRYDARAD